MERSTVSGRGRTRSPYYRLSYELIVIAVAALIYVGAMASPPSLMDDVDAVQAQIARNMVESGDWVTARLNGVKYLEKSPLIYWAIATCYQIFGIHDWAARIPIVLSVVLLCWLAARMGAWAFSPEAGLYSGIVLATCIGLFLFTRILIPDVTLTLTVALSLWAFLRALDEDEARPGLWSAVMAAGIGIGLLLKGLIAVLFPVAAAGLFLLATGQWRSGAAWRRLHPFRGALIALAIAAPWHVMATLRNPPYLVFSMESGPGNYRGFFWFYFMNEHVLRFLNMRFPRDYNTVPRLYFWLFHLLWLFPWSVFLPAAAGGLRSGFGEGRAGRMRRLAICWLGFILIFFTFSSTQEYYSMPAYPAFALLLGSALAQGDSRSVRVGKRVLAAVAGAAAVAIAAIWVSVRNLPTPGDISQALTQNPELYTLSLGHMGDLTLASFAYLRPPLLLAGIAFAFGALAAWRLRGTRLVLGIAAMMILFLHAARLAMVTFDPYLSSRPLAKALIDAPPGNLILDNQYYSWSSVIFYTNRRAMLLNGRVNNLEYGSNAPDAPRDVFISDADLIGLWRGGGRQYLLVEKPSVARIQSVLGPESIRTVAESGGKYLLTNL